MSKYVLKLNKNLSKLRDRCDEINAVQEGKKVSSIIRQLKETLVANKDLVALAAPQLNHKYRIFCIRFADGDIRAFVNPMITKSEGIHLSRENNLSLFESDYVMPRNDKIIVAYQTPVGRVEQNIFEGAAAEIFQQEVNLIDGVLLDEFGLEVIPEFDKATKKEQQEVIDFWLKSLKDRGAELNEEIQKDPESLQIKKAIDFMAGVAKGDIQIDKVESPKPEEKDESRTTL